MLACTYAWILNLRNGKILDKPAHVTAAENDLKARKINAKNEEVFHYQSYENSLGTTDHL